MKPLLETILSRKLHDPKVVIYSWLDEYGIKNYTVNDKGEIDVNGDVDLSYRGLKEFPSYIQFGTVKGGFDCYYNNLTSLRGCPRVVKKSFYCHDNNLVSLEGSPEEVEFSFLCQSNNLRDLKGAPKKVGRDFYCDSNSTQFTEDDVKKVCKVRGKIFV